MFVGNGSQTRKFISSVPLPTSPITPFSPYRVRREKAWSTTGLYPPGNWFAPPGSNQSSSGGNDTAEASGADGRSSGRLNLNHRVTPRLHKPAYFQRSVSRETTKRADEELPGDSKPVRRLLRCWCTTQLGCASSVASDLLKRSKGCGLVVFNIQVRLQPCFLQHLLHVFCRARTLCPTGRTTCSGRCHQRWPQ
jgi:hypothetical protein